MDKPKEIQATLNFWKLKDKEKPLEAARQKGHITYRRTIRMTKDFSPATMKGRSKRRVFQALKIKPTANRKFCNQ